MEKSAQFLVDNGISRENLLSEISLLRHGIAMRQSGLVCLGTNRNAEEDAVA